ncbi:MAG: NTP transferase domain-containing protein [Cyclobacteriaceae bacterium]
MTSKENDLYGLVLAGGQGSRMGTDKGDLSYYGIPQREHMLNLLSEFCSKVFTSCSKDADSKKYKNPIVDKYDFNSPLNGILSAMEAHSQKAWLSVAVDMPLIDAEALKYLVSNRDATRFATCFYDSTGIVPEPMLTIWEPKCLEPMLEMVKASKWSPRDLLTQVGAKMLLAPDRKVLMNVNDRASYMEALKMIKK